MSDHAWAQEHVAAYLAGGLDVQEAERLDAHARDCPACASALADARRLDTGLLNLFATARPDPVLEDRAIARVRTPTPYRPALNRRVRWAGAVAAVLLLGVIGALVPEYGHEMRERQIEAAKREIRSTSHTSVKALSDSLPNDDLGVDTSIEAALPEIARLDKLTLDGTVDGTSKGNAAELAKALQGSRPRGELYGNRVNGNPPELSFHWADAHGGIPTLHGGASSLTSGRSGATKSRLLRDDIPAPFEPAASRPKPAESPQELDKPVVPTLAAGADILARPFKAPAAEPKAPAPEPMRRVVLRSGGIEFEIESFDAATATITKLVLGIKGAFVGTVNSDKLTNGKVKGSITVRVPPEHLDGLVLDLRRELGKGGALKGVKLASQDVTKMYTDLESRLKAARTMEQRLLQIIKEGKGEIKQLLEAEKELGVWRTKIEEFEGEIRYYANLAAFSTLTVALTEKEIKAAAAVTERERVQAGVEVEDVDKAYQQLLAAVVEAKGRIAQSELKQLAAGQFNAIFSFAVPAEAGGPVRDRLRMLGRVARLEIDRTVQTEGGTLPSDAKPRRGDTVFLVQLYNLANVAPRETAVLHVAVPDVPAAYQALRDAVAKTAGRVLVAQLNEQDRQNISAQYDFEVKRSDEAAVRAALDAAGDVLSRQVGRAAEGDSVTDSKVLYRVTVVSANHLLPRETLTVAVEVADVGGAATLFAAQVSEAKGRQVDAKFDRDARGQATAHLVFEVPLPAAAGLAERFKSAGTVRVSRATHDPKAPEGRYATARIDVTVTNVEAIVADGNGLWPKVRQGLTISASVLLTSVTWVVFGLCVVLPWAVIRVRRLPHPPPHRSTRPRPRPGRS